MRFTGQGAEVCLAPCSPTPHPLELLVQRVQEAVTVLLQRGPASPRLPQLQCAVYWPGYGGAPHVSDSSGWQVPSGTSHAVLRPDLTTLLRCLAWGTGPSLDPWISLPVIHTTVSLVYTLRSYYSLT